MQSEKTSGQIPEVLLKYKKEQMFSAKGVSYGKESKNRIRLPGMRI